MEFDIKKELRKKIRKEIRPILYEQGFVLNKPTSYIRETNGLLQQFYFQLRTCGLRPWVSYRPVFDTRCIVSIGTDNTGALIGPYSGFKWLYLKSYGSNDYERMYKDYTHNVLPAFEKLKQSIINGIIPEFNKINSLDKLITAVNKNDLIFNRKPTDFAKRYLDFILQVSASSGVERMSIIIKETEIWELPKIVKKHLDRLDLNTITDEEADCAFDVYCNKIRIANKLIKG